MFNRRPNLFLRKENIFYRFWKRDIETLRFVAKEISLQKNLRQFVWSDMQLLDLPNDEGGAV